MTVLMIFADIIGLVEFNPDLPTMNLSLTKQDKDEEKNVFKDALDKPKCCDWSHFAFSPIKSNSKPF